MNCQEFEQGWNDWVDQYHRFPTELDPPLSRHAVGCSQCRDRAEAYLMLTQAFEAWSLAPSLKAPEGSVDRIAAAWNRQEPRHAAPAARRSASGSRWWGWAAAAALLAATWLGYRWAPDLAETTSSSKAPIVAIEPAMQPSNLETAPAITLALTEATSATLELARATSAPAARVGRQVLASTTSSRVRPEILPSVSLGSATRVLQTVGEQLDAGVQPLSGTARQAFGFLLGPGATEQEPPAPESNGRDA